MAKIGNPAGLRKIKEATADQTVASSKGKTRVRVAGHIVNGQIVQDLLIGQAE